MMIQQSFLVLCSEISSFVYLLDVWMYKDSKNKKNPFLQTLKNIMSIILHIWTGGGMHCSMYQ